MTKAKFIKLTRSAKFNIFLWNCATKQSWKFIDVRKWKTLHIFLLFFWSKQKKLFWELFYFFGWRSMSFCFATSMTLRFIFLIRELKAKRRTRNVYLWNIILRFFLAAKKENKFMITDTLNSTSLFLRVHTIIWFYASRTDESCCKFTVRLCSIVDAIIS